MKHQCFQCLRAKLALFAAMRSLGLIDVLDTNVIYPIEIRDLLFWFAYYDLYTPKWIEHIFDEWAEVMRRMDVSE